MKDRLPFGRAAAYTGIVVIFSLVLIAPISSNTEKQYKSVHAWDLRRFGYSSEARDYSMVCFLSEDLLLVAINQAPMIYPHPLIEDTPEAVLVLFDVRNDQALRITRMPVLKAGDSVAWVPEEQFLVLSRSEVKLCSADFLCDRSFPTKGPFRLSSNHTRAVVGGNRGSPATFLDSRTLAVLAGEDLAQISAEGHRHYNPDDSFVDSVSSADGARAMRVETKQSRWSKITNPLAALGERPFNIRKITVYEKQTGQVVFALQWDPRHDWGGLTRDPALSPAGHKVALLRRGVLEAFEIP